MITTYILFDMFPLCGNYYYHNYYAIRTRVPHISFRLCRGYTSYKYCNILHSLFNYSDGRSMTIPQLSKAMNALSPLLPNNHRVVRKRFRAIEQMIRSGDEINIGKWHMNSTLHYNGKRLKWE